MTLIDASKSLFLLMDIYACYIFCVCSSFFVVSNKICHKFVIGTSFRSDILKLNLKT